MTFAAVALIACEGSSDNASGAYGGYYDGCRQFTTCGTCTPVEGCGWCFNSDGTGMCASDPDECVTPAFSWTWNSTGCRVAATVATPDAAPSIPAESDAAPPTEDVAVGAIDAGESDAAPVVDSGSPGDAATDR
jgi:hypothetical protein